MICARGIRGASDGPDWAARQVAGEVGPLVTTLEASLVGYAYGPEEEIGKSIKLKSRAETRLKCMRCLVCWNSQLLFRDIFLACRGPGRCVRRMTLENVLH